MSKAKIAKAKKAKTLEKSGKALYPAMDWKPVDNDDNRHIYAFVSVCIYRTRFLKA